MKKRNQKNLTRKMKRKLRRRKKRLKRRKILPRKMFHLKKRAA